MRAKLLGAAMAAIVTGASAGALAADTLRIAHYDNPAQFGMPYGTFGANGAYQLYAFFDGVTFVDGERNTNPQLATEWRSTGPNTWEIKLRQGVTFHDGTPWNADAFVANIDAIKNDPVVSKQQAARQINSVASAKKIDDYSVEVTTSFTDPILMRTLHIMRPHSPKAWADLGAEKFGRNPIGTGSYKIVSWEPDRVKGTAYENAWRKPKIQNLDIVVVPEVPGRVQALNSGQVEIAWSVDADSIPQIEANGNKVAINTSNDTLNLILLHTKPGPLADVRVRQALNYAYDKEAFVQTVLRSTAIATGQPAASPMSGYFADIKPYPYDPEKAKQLLAEAGFANGFDFKAEIVTSTGEFKDTMQAMANDFKRVGVNMELSNIAVPDFVQKVLRIKQWEGDAFSMMYEGHPSADIARVMGTHSCLVQEFSNREPHTCFPELNPTLKAMMSELDPAKRDALMRQVAQYYHDNAPIVFSHERTRVDGLSPKVMNYKLINRVINYHEIELAN
jgi:peptide/nickel transport system substrate-binding protein